MYDVLIIGAGVVGCSVARYLSRYALNVAVLEKASDVSDGTSKANTGIVHSGHDAKPGTQKAYFNKLGNEMYPELCAELNVPFKRNGTLVVAFSDGQMDEVAALVGQAKLNGVPEVSAIDAKKLFELEPNISRSAKGALWAKTGGIVSPYSLTVALAENAAQNGVEFFLETKVEKVKKNGGGFIVTTDKGEFTSKILVNCAGLFADEINNMLSKTKYTITARRGEYLILDKRYAGTFNAAIFQLPVKLASGHTKGIVIAPTVSGTIMLGPTADDVGKTELQNTAAGFDAVLEGAAKSWDSIPRGDIISCFAGLRAHADINDFVVGEADDVCGFYNCLGIESPGLTSAPAIGEHVADLVAERLAAKKNSSFEPRREKKKAFRDMSDAEREAAIKENPDYGTIVCRCETVTEAEVRAAVKAPVGARTLDAVKRRTRAGMGRCQSGFCSTRVMEILSEELGVPMTEIKKGNSGSEMVCAALFDGEDRQ